MTEVKQHWTATQVKALLQVRFGGGGQSVVLFEVRDQTGHSASRSIDAVTMSLWPSLGLELIGMEIKVSRSDWLRELKEPAKASATFEYFDRWYLVAPRHVAKIDEIPGPWGWYAPEGDKLLKMKDAPRNDTIKPLDRRFLAAMLRCQSKADEGLIKSTVDLHVRSEVKRLEEMHRQRVAAEVERKSQADTADAKSWRELVEKLGSHRGWLPSDEIAGAIKLVNRLGVGGTYGVLSRLQGSIDAAAKEVAGVIAELQSVAGEKLEASGEERVA